MQEMFLLLQEEVLSFWQEAQQQRDPQVLRMGCRGNTWPRLRWLQLGGGVRRRRGLVLAPGVALRPRSRTRQKKDQQAQGIVEAVPCLLLLSGSPCPMRCTVLAFTPSRPFRVL